jgi:hypothetical protein
MQTKPNVHRSHKFLAIPPLTELDHPQLEAVTINEMLRVCMSLRDAGQVSSPAAEASDVNGALQSKGLTHKALHTGAIGQLDRAYVGIMIDTAVLAHLWPLARGHPRQTSQNQ